MKEPPLIVVLGATATGKSQLAVDIALKYNGEVISTDSMQVYKGLDIITNKVTAQEMKGVKHHLIDFIEHPERITVVDFKEKAVKVIESIRQSGKIPVLVGGTNYYIEAVLWEVLINSGESSDSTLLLERERIKAEEASSHLDSVDLLSSSNIFDHQIHAKSFLGIPSAHLHAILDEIDHDAAILYHPQEKRKIIRALQVYQQTGVKYSQHLARQRSKGSTLGGPLRYKNVICLWARSENNILKQRINKRVHTMIENGLLEELTSFHEKYNKQRLECPNDHINPYTHGIFQSIGFKEFHSYLTCDTDDEKFKQKLLEESILDLKLATRKYAKTQEKWIQNRFIHAGDRDVPSLYTVDTSSPEKWDETVLTPVFQLLDYLLHESRVTPLLQPEEKLPRKVTQNHLFYCEVCKIHAHGDVSWSSHLKSKKHKALSRASRSSSGDVCAKYPNASDAREQKGTATGDS